MMNENSNTALKNWIEKRLPVFSFLEALKNYKVPNNLNYLWNLGFVAAIAILLQMLTGVFLAVHYTPHIDYAFESVKNIIYNVHYGWFIQAMHEVGASLIFIVLYLHMFKAIYYRSYKNPRELVWIFGVALFHLMMTTAFMGYALPMTQQSYWSVTVISNLFADLPFIGNFIKSMIIGCNSICTETLGRFFVFHFLIPFIMIVMGILHVISLHNVGGNNPSNDDKIEKIPFFPKYFLRDMLALFVFLLIMSVIIFYVPRFYNSDFIMAEPTITPDNIRPDWYFMPYFTILKSSSSKYVGIILFLLSNIILYFLPWLDKSRQKNSKYHKIITIIFAVDMILLACLGFFVTAPKYTYIFAVSYYFAYFLVLLPLGAILIEKKNG